MYRAFSLTWPAAIQIYWNKRKRLLRKRVQLPQYLFGTSTSPPFYCFGIPEYGRRDVKWRHSVISANRHFEKHSDVPYKPLKAVLARQIKIICSIKCNSFFFRWAQFLLVKINWKGSLSCVILQHGKRSIEWFQFLHAFIERQLEWVIYWMIL